MTFYTETICKSPAFNSTNKYSGLDLLEPWFRQAVLNILARARAVGRPLMVTETFRSKPRQALLYKQGATHLPTVGVHHYGLACDFAKMIDGTPEWSGPWTEFGQWCAAEGLVWGGDWDEPTIPHTFRDWDHCQRVDLKDQNALFAGTFYPDASYTIMTRVSATAPPA